MALLLFEETRQVSESGALWDIKVCLSEAKMLRNSSSVSFMSKQQKEGILLNQELFGGSKLCLAEAEEAKGRMRAGRLQPLWDDLSHLITAVRPPEGL